MQTWPNPFIEQRADPYILHHEGQYYFIASVPSSSIPMEKSLHRSRP